MEGVKVSSWLQTIELLPPQSYLSPKFKFTVPSRPTTIKTPNWPTTMPSYAMVRNGLLDNLLGYLPVRGIKLRSLEQGELGEREVRCPCCCHVAKRHTSGPSGLKRSSTSTCSKLTRQGRAWRGAHGLKQRDPRGPVGVVEWEKQGRGASPRHYD